MKKIIILLLAVISIMSCTAQDKKKDDNQKKEKDTPALAAEQPKGTWRVDKQFDEEGKLIRYDSIYSWGSTDNLDSLIQRNPDSLLQSFHSKFYRNYSGIDNQRFGDLLADDSLFTERFFHDDFFESEFGEELMTIDRIRERMESMQQNFLERYQSEFEKPENKGPKGVN